MCKNKDRPSMQRFQSGEFRYTNVKAVLICLNPFNVNFHFYSTSLTTDYQLGEIRTQSFKVYSLKNGSHEAFEREKWPPNADSK